MKTNLAMTMRNKKASIQRLALTLALSLPLLSCQVEEVEGYCTKIGKDCDWGIKQGMNVVHNANGDITYNVNLNDVAPFNAYVNKELVFQSPCAIQRIDFVGGVTYFLIDYTPIENVIDLYQIPVTGGKLVRVIGSFLYDKTGSFEGAILEALVEVSTPLLNEGKPIYLIYDLQSRSTSSEVFCTHFKRAAWEPLETPHKRSVEELIRGLNLPAQ